MRAPLSGDEFRPSLAYRIVPGQPPHPGAARVGQVVDDLDPVDLGQREGLAYQRRRGGGDQAAAGVGGAQPVADLQPARADPAHQPAASDHHAVAGDGVLVGVPGRPVLLALRGEAHRLVVVVVGGPWHPRPQVLQRLHDHAVGDVGVVGAPAAQADRPVADRLRWSIHQRMVAAGGRLPQPISGGRRPPRDGPGSEVAATAEVAAAEVAAAAEISAATPVAAAAEVAAVTTTITTAVAAEAGTIPTEPAEPAEHVADEQAAQEPAAAEASEEAAVPGPVVGGRLVEGNRPVVDQDLPGVRRLRLCGLRAGRLGGAAAGSRPTLRLVVVGVARLWFFGVPGCRLPVYL